MRYGKTNQEANALSPNKWDLIAFIIVIGIVLAFGFSAEQMFTSFIPTEQIKIDLNPTALPSYALKTVLRMFIAMLFSLGFTFSFGTLAAKNKYAEQIIIPFIDIMQSVPILGFMAISIGAFTALFPNSLIGPECAAIFAIFTSQVWNMALSFYQSLKTLPVEIKQATKIFQLSSWQTFWRVEVPFALPGLLWNAMISMSAGWFFVVASEAISVAGHQISLPGIGSYIALAIQRADIHAIGYAILTMFIVITLYDQLIFRPFISWSERFKIRLTPEEDESESWVLDVIQETKILKKITIIFDYISRKLLKINFNFKFKKVFNLPNPIKKTLHFTKISLWQISLILFISISIYLLLDFIIGAIPRAEILHVLFLGFITAGKVAILILLASLIWVPIGVWLGLKPKWAKFFMPITQFVAAFPMNLIYPIVVLGIIKFKLNVNIWTTPLMILGTQWYILFNVIAGANTIPKDLILATRNLGLKKWLWWKKLALPGIFPYYVTGAMAAAGGCWNASIVADVVSWGDTTLHATGLGAYIIDYTTAGDFPRIALGISVMCLYVTVFNRLIWHKLYTIAEERYAIS